MVRFSQIFTKSVCALALMNLFLISYTAADTQIDKNQAVLVLTQAINRAIDAHQAKSSNIQLREKVMHRVAQCAFIYGVMSKNLPDPDLRKQSGLVSEIMREVLTAISLGIGFDRYKQIVSSASDSLEKPRDKREHFLLLRNCKSLNEPSEIQDAVLELTY